MGSVAMTALIGRVPIDGTVNDPFPFKVLIGADNLTANGIELPEVAGAIVSGTASGDWTLSCVRGAIRSMTFVFHDGTIRTVSSASSGSPNGGSTSQGLGWISDPHGIPCVSGARRSNARQYLTSQTLITAAGAGAASLIDADSGSFSYVNGSNGSLGTVGISGNEAMGRILASGVQDLSQWGQQALWTGVRGGLCPTGRTSRRAPGAAARDRLRDPRTQGEPSDRRHSCTGPGLTRSARPYSPLRHLRAARRARRNC